MRLLLPVLVGLTLLQVAWHPPGDPEGGRVLSRRFPGAVEQVVLAAARPFLLQLLYAEVQAAREEGRLLEVMRDVELILRAEPRNIRAAIYFAETMAYDLAGSGLPAPRRMHLVRRGLQVLQRVEEQHPGDHRPATARGLILKDRVFRDEELRGLSTRSTGMDPLEEAMQAFETAARRSGGMRVLRVLFADTALERVLERVVHRRIREARALLSSSLARGRDLPGGLTAAHRRALEAWHLALDGLVQGEAAALARGLQDLRDRLAGLPDPEEGGSPREEIAVWLGLLPGSLEVAGREVEEGRTGAALRVLRALHSIQALVVPRLTGLSPGNRLQPPSPGYTTGWEAVVKALIRKAPELREELRGLERPW